MIVMYLRIVTTGVEELWTSRAVWRRGCAGLLVDADDVVWRWRAELLSRCQAASAARVVCRRWLAERASLSSLHPII